MPLKTIVKIVYIMYCVLFHRRPPIKVYKTLIEIFLTETVKPSV